MSDFATIAHDNECLTTAVAGGGDLRKEAQDTLGTYTYRRVREGSVFRKVLTPIEEPDSRYNVKTGDSRPTVTYEMEQDVMMGMAVPYDSQSIEQVFMVDRYEVSGQRVMTPRVVFDAMQLKTVHYDVKTVFANNMMRDALAIEDTAFVTTVNAMLGGSANTTIPSTGLVHWNQWSGGITRDSLVEGGLQTLNFPYNIKSLTAVASSYTVGQVAKFDRNEAGGDIAEDLLENGAWMKAKLNGETYYGSIKNWLIPNFRVYHFGPSDMLGRTVMFDSAKMYIEEKRWIYSMEMSWVIGTTLVNNQAMAIVDHS